MLQTRKTMQEFCSSRTARKLFTNVNANLRISSAVLNRPSHLRFGDYPAN